MIRSLTLQICTSEMVAFFSLKRKWTSLCGILTGVLHDQPLNSTAQCYHTSSNPVALPSCSCYPVPHPATRCSGITLEMQERAIEYASTRAAVEMDRELKSCGGPLHSCLKADLEKLLYCRGSRGESLRSGIRYPTHPLGQGRTAIDGYRNRTTPRLSCLESSPLPIT